MTERDFKDLVSGREVNLQEVKLILADIGWDEMQRAIVRARVESSFPKPLTWEEIRGGTDVPVIK